MANAATRLAMATVPAKIATMTMCWVRNVPATVPNRMAAKLATFKSALAVGRADFFFQFRQKPVFRRTKKGALGPQQKKAGQEDRHTFQEESR
jgi:hypothetical protein